MEMLGTYELTGHLTSENSGFSLWGFGRKGGKDYFIKQFLSPKYPVNDTMSSPERIARLERKCKRFEERKHALYEQLNAYSDGNAVRIEEFFRVETKYYITMRKIESIHWQVEDIVALPESQKRFLCAVIAHAVSGLAKAGIVHADLKHDNVLFMYTKSGNVTAKVIDFDSGFLESDPPGEGEEIVGDLVYFSPEACMTFMGRPTELTSQMDVFALGVLFHQYFTGDLPGFDVTKGGCAGEAVANGDSVTVSDKMPADVHDLLVAMLDADPHKRPTALEVYAKLERKTAEEIASVAAPEPAAVEPVSSASAPTGFFAAGDL